MISPGIYSTKPWQYHCIDIYKCRCNYQKWYDYESLNECFDLSFVSDRHTFITILEVNDEERIGSCYALYMEQS
jgi:hypothetical protein